MGEPCCFEKSSVGMAKFANDEWDQYVDFTAILDVSYLPNVFLQ